MSTALFPTTWVEAAAARSEHPDAVVVAGGTDVMVAVNAGHHRVDRWMSTRRIADSSVISGQPGDRSAFRLGAGVTFAQLERHARTPALAQAARTVGSPQIRAAGTIGGNLVTASPAGDSLPVLACYDAVVELVSPTGTRLVGISDFLVGPKRTVLLADELVAAVQLPATHGSQAYAKVGRRNAMVIAVCSLAVRLDLANNEARLALGSVGPTVIRVPIAERLLLQGAPVTEVAHAVADAARPIDDHRATARYRRHATEVLARRLCAWVREAEAERTETHDHG